MSEAKKHDVIQVQQAQVPANEQQGTSLMAILARAAADPNVDVTKMKALLDMQQDLEAKEAERQFAQAMNGVQKAIRPVVTDKKNDQTRSRYATYEALDRVVRPIYIDHGFSPSFGTADSGKDSTVLVTCDLMHSAGHIKRYQIDMPADGKGAKGNDVMTKTHATGSALSYGKRYLLIAMFNIPVTDKDDDDGNRAGQAYLITAEQKEQIIALMKETNADTAKFLEFMAVDTLDELPAGKFQKAVNMLNAKKAKVQQ